MDGGGQPSHPGEKTRAARWRQTWGEEMILRCAAGSRFQDFSPLSGSGKAAAKRSKSAIALSMLLRS